MKTLARMIIAVLVMLLLGLMAGTSADARGGHGGHGPQVGVGLWLGPGWGPGWGGSYYSPYYYPPYYPYYPPEQPIVIQQQPEVYVQPAPEAEQQPIYWYYCKDPQGYYPYVKQCPSGWMKVVPTPPAPASPPPE
jgi:hypothetical protein